MTAWRYFCVCRGSALRCFWRRRIGAMADYRHHGEGEPLIEEEGLTICHRNRIMTGVKFLLRVTMRRHDLAAEIYHLKELQKVPVVLSPDEVKRILLMAPSLKARTMLTISYGCGLRAGEVTRLTVGDIDGAQNIIRVLQGKGRKDRNVMLPPAVLALLREWWRERSARDDAGMPP